MIVESPTKAKTISRFLGHDFIVESSFGHIRDLPKSKMGIDIEHNFKPQYVIPKDKQKRVDELLEKAKKSSRIILATDEDREGEAIAWHLAEALGTRNGPPPAGGVPHAAGKASERIVFHEITKKAILAALENPRTIDQHLVDAQQARRVLDRLVGYELSPFLWRKVARGLSAGRVQSAALRLCVEREEEIAAFIVQEFWTIEGECETAKKPFPVTLVTLDGKTLEKFDIKTSEEANAIKTRLGSSSATITSITRKHAKRSPHAPFTTSTLQQEANRRLGFSAKQTMRLAQQLYEGIDLGADGHVGLITYMRTDAVTLSKDFTAEAASIIQSEFGKDYWKEERTYTTKSKLAQEAHEAIRPTHAGKNPATIKPYLDAGQWKLYDLIWRRAIGSQMSDAEIDQTAVEIESKSNATTAGWKANGSIVTFDGWLKLYPSDHKSAELPELTESTAITLTSITPEQHFTQPPARYSDATLVKALEEFGIGRPSTYAPTISTIVDRKYVDRTEDKRLKPTDIGILVTKVLKEHFPHIVDYQFTATMEDDFDAIAQGEKKWQPVIAEFYKPFHENLLSKEETVSKKELTEEVSDETCEKCGKPMISKVGRFGKFLACSAYPECKSTRPIKGSKEEQDEKQELEGPVPACPECAKPMQLKRGRFGSFWGCTGYPKCKGIKNIERTTGLKCPKCSKGDVIARRSKRGKTFYGCNKYPDCDFVLWSKPVIDESTKEPKFCPNCKSVMIYGAKNTIVCSSKECGYKEESTMQE